MTVKTPKSVVPTDVANIIGAINSLQASTGWAIMLEIMNDNVKYLEKCIIDKFDPLSKSELTDKDIEFLRVKRTLNIDLRDTPQNYIKNLTASGKVPENYDPYFQSADDIKKASTLTTE